MSLPWSMQNTIHRPAWPEPHVQGVGWVVGGMAPGVTDGAKIHVVVDIVGDEKVVGDAADEVGRERGPAGTAIHGRESKRTHARKELRVSSYVQVALASRRQKPVVGDAFVEEGKKTERFTID